MQRGRRKNVSYQPPPELRPPAADEWIKRFLAFHGMRHPRDMGAAEITSFLSSLATRGHVSAATQNQAFSALLFLFREVLGREVLGLEEVVRAKRHPGSRWS